MPLRVRFVAPPIGIVWQCVAECLRDDGANMPRRKAGLMAGDITSEHGWIDVAAESLTS